MPRKDNRSVPVRKRVAAGGRAQRRQTSRRARARSPASARGSARDVDCESSCRIAAIPSRFFVGRMRSRLREHHDREQQGDELQCRRDQERHCESETRVQQAAAGGTEDHARSKHGADQAEGAGAFFRSDEIGDVCLRDADVSARRLPSTIRAAKTTAIGETGDCNACDVQAQRRAAPSRWSRRSG